MASHILPSSRSVIFHERLDEVPPFFFFFSSFFFLFLSLPFSYFPSSLFPFLSPSHFSLSSFSSPSFFSPPQHNLSGDTDVAESLLAFFEQEGGKGDEEEKEKEKEKEKTKSKRRKSIKIDPDQEQECDEKQKEKEKEKKSKKSKQKTLEKTSRLNGTLRAVNQDIIFPVYRDIRTTFYEQFPFKDVHLSWAVDVNVLVWYCCYPLL